MPRSKKVSHLQWHVWLPASWLGSNPAAPCSVPAAPWEGAGRRTHSDALSSEL